MKFKKEKVAIFENNIFLYISISQNLANFLIYVFPLFSVSLFFFLLPIIKSFPYYYYYYYYYYYLIYYIKYII